MGPLRAQTLRFERGGRVVADRELERHPDAGHGVERILVGVGPGDRAGVLRRGVREDLWYFGRRRDRRPVGAFRQRNLGEIEV